MADEWEWEGMMMGTDDGPAIVDEIQGTDEISLSSRLHKTEEEIQKFSVDENLSDVERAVTLLKNGATVQKMSVVGSLCKLIQDYPDEFKSAILPILLDIVTSEPPLFQKTLGKAMSELMIAYALPPKFIQMMNPTSRKLMDNKDEDVVAVWADVYIATIKHISIETIIQQILPEALVDGGLAQPATFRIWCGRVLGAAASRLDGKRIEELFFHKALNLCQDTDYEVRKSMCHQLNVIAKAVGIKLTKSDVIPEYVELLVDEEAVVRQAAIENVISLMEFLDLETKVSSLIPLWKKLCDERLQNVLPLLIKYMGSFLWQTRNEMTESDKRFFFAFFQSMANSAEDEYRAMCAYNFPAMVTIFKPGQFESLKFDKLLETLSGDSCLQVRKHLAAGFHELSILLGTSSYRLLKTSFVKLIASNEKEVLLAVVDNFPVIVKNFYLDENAKQNNALLDIMTTVNQKVKECEQNTITWRPIYQLLTLYALFPEFVESDPIFEHAVPTLFRLLTGNVALPIKKLIFKTLVFYLRRLKRVEHRETVLKQLLGNPL